MRTVCPERDVKFGWYLRAEYPETAQFLLTVAITSCTADTESLLFIITAIENQQVEEIRYLTLSCPVAPTDLRATALH